MKKLLGTVLFIIGCILALVILSRIPETIDMILGVIVANQVDQWAFLFGSLTTSLAIGLLSFFIIRYGVILLKK